MGSIHGASLCLSGGTSAMRGDDFAQGPALDLRATDILPGTAGRKTRPRGMSVALSGAPGEACAETTLPGVVRQGVWKV